MKKSCFKSLLLSLIFIFLFLIWTALVLTVNVNPVGPLETKVGLSGFNLFVHNLTGVNMSLYDITDILGLVPVCFAAGFGILGFIQLIKRKSLFKVDHSILLLGVFYIIVICSFVLFEKVVINYRPVLIEGVLEASYPSSTTLLTLCVMPTSILQLKLLLKNKIVFRLISVLISVFTVFMVVARLVSGVHWVTDIIGGVLLSAGLVCAYYASVFKIKMSF